MKNAYVVIPIVILCLLIQSISHAQITQPSRYEKEFKYGDGLFTIISLKEDGICLIRDKDKYSDGKKIWEVILLDTALKEEKTLELLLEIRNNLVGYEHTPGHVYLLFRQGETNKNELEVLEIRLSDYSQNHYSINPELSLQLSHFTKVGSSILLGGYVNREPTILLYNLTDRSIKVLPGFFQKDTELVDLRVNQNNTFNAVLINRDVRDQYKLILRSFDEAGKILLEDEVTIDAKHGLQAGITSTLERDDMIITGNWGINNSKQSSGFFAIPVDPFSDQKIQYFHFGELEHFLDHLSSKRAKNIKEKSLKEIKEGRIPNYVNYVIPYRLQEYDSGYLLFAEIYQPSSNFISQYPYQPFYSSPYDFPYWYYPGMRRLYPYSPYYYGNNRPSQQEIKTTSSVLIAFDPNGKLLWDYSIEHDDIKSSALEQVGDFNFFSSQGLLLYKKESELKIKWILTEVRETEEATEKIRLTNEGDEVRSEKEYEGGVRHWFGNSFYVWGYHTIKNNNLKDRVREVFYINKVVAK